MASASAASALAVASRAAAAWAASALVVASSAAAAIASASARSAFSCAPAGVSLVPIEVINVLMMSGSFCRAAAISLMVFSVSGEAPTRASTAFCTR
ncbi:hypothetical protein D9M70_527410 [compost metagenome]